MRKRTLIHSILSLALATTMVFGPAMTTMAEDAAVPAAETLTQETTEPEATVFEAAKPETTNTETALKTAPTVKTTEIKRSGDDFVFALDGYTAEWAEKLTAVKVGDVKLAEDQYEFVYNSRSETYSLVLKRTEEKPIVSGKEDDQKINLVLEAEGYNTVTTEVTFKCYGAKSFQIRVVGKDGKIYPLRTFSWNELESMRQAEPVYFQTGCGAGVTSFKADGVYLEDLFKAAGAEIASDDLLRVRVGDCVGPDSGWTNPQGYRVDITYGDLMEKTRYFFDGAYSDPVVKEAFSNGGYGNEKARKALAKTQKTEVKPMIALRYVESMFAEGKPVDDEYSQIIEDEKATRFLFGLAIDTDEDGNQIAEEDGHRWSTSYMAFGVDIIDPDYVPQAPVVTRKEVTRDGEEFRIALDEKATKEWQDGISKVEFNGKELRADQYEVKAGRRGTSLVIKRTDKEPLVSNADRNTKVVLKVTADGYKDLNEELTLVNYGAKSFQIRIVGKDGKIYPQKTFTWDELEKMAAGKDSYYNTICGMAGLRTFKTEGVLLSDLLDAAGVKFGEGMELQVRTNDCAETENDSETEDAYYRNGHFTYEDLMGTTRYYLNGAYENEAVRAEILKAMESGNVSDDVRRVLGKVDKTPVEPMIGLRYVESMYSDSDMDALEEAPYSEMIENERAMRFLFGLKMDENDPTMLSKETTTWSATYCAFGVDIIDPEYVETEDKDDENTKPEEIKPDQQKPGQDKPDQQKPADKKDPENVKTGDASAIGLYTVMFMITAMGVAVYAFRKRRYTDK